MTALLRVLVLVEGRAVEPPEAMRIVGKVPGYPIEQHREPGAVAGIDQRREISRSAEAAGGGEQPGRLIAPGAVEWMLADGQEFDVGEAHLAGIAGQLLGELAKCQPAIAFLGAPAPRAEMDFIDRYRSVEPVGIGGRRLGTRQRFQIDHDRCGQWAQLHRKGDRIRFEQQRAVRADDLVLVFVVDPCRGHEDLPKPVAAHAHRVPPPIPEIEVADDAHAAGIGRKDREGDAFDALEHHRMRAELVVQAFMGALAQEVEVEIGEDRREAVGILELHDVLAETHPHVIAGARVRQRSGEQAGIVDAPELADLAAVVDQRDRRRVRQEDAHDLTVILLVRPQIPEWIMVPALDDRISVCRKCHHAGTSPDRARMRRIPASGTRNQSGRCASSYSSS